MFHVILLFLTLLSFGLGYTTLSDQTLKSLPNPGNDFHIKDGALLAPILRTRVPGTPGSTAVLQHFVDFFHTNLPEWRLEFQNSTSKTPATGNELIPFVNLIATRDPPWSEPGDVSRLALVAHYDSKLTPTGFIGATDSAAPCAMVMHAARSIDAALTERWEKMKAEGVGSAGYNGVKEEKGIQILLLDGEEAFLTWTHTDSLYGARYGSDNHPVGGPLNLTRSQCASRRMGADCERSDVDLSQPIGLDQPLPTVRPARRKRSAHTVLFQDYTLGISCDGQH